MATRVTNGLNLDGHKIESLGTPTVAADAATKQYVDDAVAGSAAGFIAGDGLDLVPDPPNDPTLNVTTGDGIEIDGSGDVAVDQTWLTGEFDSHAAGRKYAANVGNASDDIISVTHNLGSEDVHVTLRHIATGQLVIADPRTDGPNAVDLHFGTAPGTDEYRVIISR
ncbi:hypothetical protein [Hoyosella altamirensis]|uniref:Uncharacterized protein n=1 Tax=Hoyosella altamirensis TaxID=616997 RepID=A0A839RU01_9ACTN|nr:hypothetical protein [Hoyosella altamirensis]MBB3039807.1 hypothetical protein [Hoyosella altamirensis]